jgi:hypothetical protein
MSARNRSAPGESPAVDRTLSVIAQDPSIKDPQGNILMSKIRVPQEVTQPGPIGYRVQIVDYDATEDRFHGAHVLPASHEDQPAAWEEGRPEITADYRFHAQNVYALVMKTLARFEYALGRRVGWSFGTHQLKVAPHGMIDANAFYARDAEGLVFGYFSGRSGAVVYTCLSHDVVVHETTHALLDALRKRYLDPSSPDQAAFHEGFADVIALLSVFAQRELVEELLRRGRTRIRGLAPDMMHAQDVRVEALKKSALFGLAAQMGPEMEGVRGSALRNSASLPVDPTLRNTSEFGEPHRRGELLVAAVLHAFVGAWSTRISSLALHENRSYPLTRVAEEGSDIAEVLITMWIRALDYMPPVHLGFGDALSGALTADREARPNDSRYGLRDHIRGAFKAYGFEPAAGTADGTWDFPPRNLDYANVRFESMRSDKDEVFRFLWENRQKLELRPGAYTEVLSVRPCLRVGGDGFTLRETVAEYYQVARLTPTELLKLKIKLPAGLVDELKKYRSVTRVRRAKSLGNGREESPENVEESSEADSDEELVIPLYGGGTLIFDDYGRLKYWVHNDVFGSRQSDRLAYLYGAGLLRADRAGARLSPDRLSLLHRLRALDARKFPQEGW